MVEEEPRTVAFVGLAISEAEKKSEPERSSGEMINIGRTSLNTCSLSP